jgi:hypothetical protein
VTKEPLVKSSGIFIPVIEVAIACEWVKRTDPQWKRDAACKKAKAWLAEKDCLVTHNGKNYTTKEMLRKAFPDIWEEYEMARFEADDD